MSSAPVTLSSLSASIPTAITHLTNLLQQSSLPPPSFSEAAAVSVSTQKPEPQALLKARNDLINQAHDLLLLARGPIDHLVSLSYAAIDTANLGVVSKFNIPAHIPANSTVPLSELVAATGLPQSELARTLRYAVTKGLFTEPAPGEFGHSAASATLAGSKALQDVVGVDTDLSARITACLPEALWAKHGLGKADAPDTGFNAAYPGYGNIFEYFGKNPERGREYFNFLNGRAELPRYLVGHVSGIWDWKSVEGGVIIDVGGSSGFTAMEFARQVPSAKVIVQDITVEGFAMGEEIVAKDAQLKGRVEFMKHDFFTAQTVTADVYFFRHILHDWPDEACIKILRQLLPALKDGSRVLVSEGVLPETSEGRAVSLDDVDVLWVDHVMMAAHNGRERSISEYTKLFEAADPGYSYVGTAGPLPGIFHSLLEYKYTKPA